MLQPLDDWPAEHRPKPAEIQGGIERCVEEFRKRLQAEARTGRVIVGYGPVQ